MKDHLTTECVLCSDDIYKDYLEIVANQVVTSNKRKELAVKKWKFESSLIPLKQTGLSEFMKSTKLSDIRQNNINATLAMADHSFFIKFYKQLYQAYDLSCHITVSTNILHFEVATITIKI